MTRKDDDYLWDRSGAPDPEVERLEELLAPLRSQRPAPALPPGEAGRAVRFEGGKRSRSRIVFTITAAAAALLVGVAALVVWTRLGRETVEVAALEGTPRIGSSVVHGSGKLAIGERLTTDDGSRARIDMAVYGQVVVDPGTRIALAASRASEKRLSLERGTIHALIWAPPRLFQVETPSATAIDLGCAYTLTVDDSGAGLLSVTRGWVAFHLGDREVFVPEGAACATRPGRGPGTPYRDDASPPLREALALIDFEDASPQSARVAALETVLNESRREDALTLWHLLGNRSTPGRERVFDRLAALVPPPDGVTREGVLMGDQAMLDRWWNELGLRSASFWRMWEGTWPPRAQ